MMVGFHMNLAAKNTCAMQIVLRAQTCPNFMFKELNLFGEI